MGGCDRAHDVRMNSDLRGRGHGPLLQGGGRRLDGWMVYCGSAARVGMNADPHCRSGPCPRPDCGSAARVGMNADPHCRSGPCPRPDCDSSRARQHGIRGIAHTFGGAVRACRHRAGVRRGRLDGALCAPAQDHAGARGGHPRQHVLRAEHAHARELRLRLQPARRRGARDHRHREFRDRQGRVALRHGARDQRLQRRDRDAPPRRRAR